MKRRGFMGLFGGATAAAFVPFVLPESKVAKGVLPKWNGTAEDGAYRPTAPLTVPAPLKSKRKAFIFGSIYPNLRVQVTEKQAVQFWMGRWWTEEPKQAEALRSALKYIHEHQEQEPVAWELETAQDVERLDKAYTQRREEKVYEHGADGQNYQVRTETVREKVPATLELLTELPRFDKGETDSLTGFAAVRKLIGGK